PHVPRTLILVGLVHADAVAEPPVPANVPEPDLPLDQRERVLVVAAQRELEPAGADAVAPGFAQPSGCLLRDEDRVRHDAPSRAGMTQCSASWLSREPSCSSGTRC